MGSLLPVRESLLSGDYRALYLSWLQRVQAGEVDEDEIEPPIPPDLRSLSGALQALAELLRLEPSLVEAAVEASPAKDLLNTEEVKRWIQRLPLERKDDLLAHVIVDPGTRMDLVRECRTSFTGADEDQEGRRTAGKILAEAERRREIREREAAEQTERERKRFEAERAAAREKHLKKLADGETQAWARVDSLIAQKPARYGEAVDLLKDLGEVLRRGSRNAEFGRRIRSLRDDHARKLTFIRRLDEADVDR